MTDREYHNLRLGSVIKLKQAHYGEGVEATGIVFYFSYSPDPLIDYNEERVHIIWGDDGQVSRENKNSLLDPDMELIYE